MDQDGWIAQYGSGYGCKQCISAGGAYTRLERMALTCCKFLSLANCLYSGESTA
jgi:hypothetical protein